MLMAGVLASLVLFHAVGATDPLAPDVILMPRSNVVAKYRFSDHSNSNFNIQGLAEIEHRDEVMQVCVKSLTGKEILLDVEASDTVENMKQKLIGSEGIPSNYQELSCHNQILNNSQKVADLNILPGEAVTVYARVAGGFTEDDGPQYVYWNRVKTWASNFNFGTGTIEGLIKHLGFTNIGKVWQKNRYGEGENWVLVEPGKKLNAQSIGRGTYLTDKLPEKLSKQLSKGYKSFGSKAASAASGAFQALFEATPNTPH